MRLVFDIETPAVTNWDTLEGADEITCAWAYDLDTDTWYEFMQGEQHGLISLLEESEEVIGHNIKFFDIPALQRMAEGWTYNGIITDTKIYSQLVYPDLRVRDHVNMKKGKYELPRNLIGSYSLEAFGIRLGNEKTAPEGEWGVWTEEMHAYCKQDVGVTSTLYAVLESKGFSSESLQLEQDVRTICDGMEANGFKFDSDKAVKLYSTLVKRREELLKELQVVFPPYYKKGKPFVPKRDHAKHGYVEGVELSKVVLTDFNPSSRTHIGNRLQHLYNWKPKAFNNDGSAVIDEEVIGSLTYKEAPLLSEFLMLKKRLGQLSEGDKAWLKYVKKDGRIHGRINTNGAVTGRCTHTAPNIAQVPKVGVAYGSLCRDLFTVDKGNVLVGSDLSGIELRLLAHYLAPLDNGRYIDVVLDDDADMHTFNRNILSQVRRITRATAKTWFYAFIYGAGDFKLVSILTEGTRVPIRNIAGMGRQSRSLFESGFTGMDKLVKKTKIAHRKRGMIKGLDGRYVYTRSEHAALNTLLQSAGAIVAKKALQILFNEQLPSINTNAKLVAFVHDEYQIEVEEEYGTEVGEATIRSFKQAGEELGVRLEITGEYKVGKTWKETH
jgi:DNA polymerase I-like protein with 3'-5' exonuclease and polymerase domains